jgi:hypothetical protein
VTPRTVPLMTVACLLGVGLLSPAPAIAEQGPRLSAVLTLRGSATALHALASHRARPGAVRALAPAAAHRTRALAFARAHHLDVVRADGWSVTVSAPAAVMASAFGTTVHGSGAAVWTSDAAVPAVLAQDVGTVSGLDNRRLHEPHTHRPRGTGPGDAFPQSGATLRAAYDVPSDWQGAGVTVGVLNLSGWNPEDLSTYAIHEALPLRAAQVTEVAVDGADPRRLDGFGGEYEAALDSEAILGAAPKADQRLYFAPNTIAGVISAFQQMANDTEAGRLQAVTTSWGSCEKAFRDLTSAGDRIAYQQAIDRIVAAGATVFAASGDAGAYDCSYADSTDNEAQVDFPAAYQNTVAVGGTSLTPGAPETGWHDAGFGDYLGDGSGGGESLDQPLPSYQNGLLPGATRRLVPDVAADADPRSGLDVYVRSQGGWSTAGGTSLASPTWAGHLASALSSSATPVGIGNILPGLYQSARDPNTPGFKDIAVGNNGLFTAAPGFDQVTGLGVPDWAALGVDLLSSNRGAPSTGPAVPVQREPVSPDPSFVATPAWTRSLSVPVAVRVPTGSTYRGFAAAESLPDACARQQPTAPTTAELDPVPVQGLHDLVLTAFDSAHVCHLVRTTVGYDTVKPSSTVTAAMLTTFDNRVRIGLGGTDSGSGVGSWTVAVFDAAGRSAFRTTSTASTVITRLPLGKSYRVDVTAVDRAGNVGPTARTGITVPYDDTLYALAGSWHRVRGARDLQSSHLTSSTRGSTASLSLATRGVELILLTGPTSGYLTMTVDGRATRVDLYTATAGVRKLRIGNWSSGTRHVVKLQVLSSHRPGSRGSDISIDGVTVLP